MKVLSYNVNGIRAALKKGFAEWLKATAADVICIQETKALKEQVDTSVLEELGYYHYWFSAHKKGYSGVAIFSKKKPNKIIPTTPPSRYKLYNIPPKAFPVIGLL